MNLCRIFLEDFSIQWGHRNVIFPGIMVVSCDQVPIWILSNHVGQGNTGNAWDELEVFLEDLGPFIPLILLGEVAGFIFLISSSI